MSPPHGIYHHALLLPHVLPLLATEAIEMRDPEKGIMLPYILTYLMLAGIHGGMALVQGWI